MSCIIELLGMPPQRLLDQSKRAKNFISSKGDYLLLVTACIQIFFWNVIWARDKIKFSNLTICRLPALLHGHHAPWRHHSPQRRPIQTRQTPRPTGLQGAADRPQGLWRPALPWLHPPVPGVGARRQDDTQRRPEARLAQAEVTQAPSGGINICEDLVYVYNPLN